MDDMKVFVCTAVGFYLLLEIMSRVSRYSMRQGLVGVDYQATRYFVKAQHSCDAAKMLATTRKKLFQVVDHITVTQNVPTSLQSGCARIVQKHCHRIELTELDAEYHQTVAMNRNKGQEIHICLRDCPTCTKLTSDDKVFIVALHELAHSATAGFDPTKNGATQHSDEFKEYEKYLTQVADQLGLVDAEAVYGTQYCGLSIPHI
jgi:hypothetical protein